MDARSAAGFGCPNPHSSNKSMGDEHDKAGGKSEKAGPQDNNSHMPWSLLLLLLLVPLCGLSLSLYSSSSLSWSLLTLLLLRTPLRHVFSLQTNVCSCWRRRDGRCSPSSHARGSWYVTDTLRRLWPCLALAFACPPICPQCWVLGAGCCCFPAMSAVFILTRSFASSSL